MKTTYAKADRNRGSVAQQKDDIYQAITNQIIARLESGIVPWKQPWNPAITPRNYVSKRPYRGINALLLSGAFEKPYYLTFKQVQDLGGRVIKGSKSSMIVFAKRIWVNESGDRVYPPISSFEGLTFYTVLKRYNVFNVSQIEGIDFEFPEIEAVSTFEAIAAADEILLNIKPEPVIKHGFPGACFIPLYDEIRMPYPNQFTSSANYYTTLFHELTHWTGHPSRLNRFGFGKDTKTAYSFEELVAELGASYLTGISGFTTDEILDQSASYISGWLKVLQSDKRFIYDASNKAQRAVELLLGKSLYEEESDD